MKNSAQTKKFGFTLIETMVTILIFTMIMIGATTMFRDIFINSNQQLTSLDSIDLARSTVFNFTNEIRDAAPCNDGSYSLNLAGDTQIIFFTTYNATSTNVNRVRYYLATTTLYKGIVTPSGSPLSYNIANEKITAVVTNVATTTKIFNYYDGNYAGTSSPLTQPINVNNVKFVTINLSLTKQDVRNETATSSVSAGATIRNLKTNLGN